MRISRHLLMTCAVATFLTPTIVNAFDNEAQIRARQALEEKMKQADTQTPPETSAPPAVVTQPPPAPPVTNVQAPAAQPDQVHQALEEKMREIQATSAPPAVVTKPAPAKKAPAPKPQPPVVTVTPNKTTVENPPAQATPAFAPEISQPATPTMAAPATSAPSMAPSTDAATSDKLSDALHQKMHETETERVTPVVPPVVTTQPPVQPPTTARPAQPSVPAPAVTSGPNYAPIPEPSATARPTLPNTPTPAPAPTVGNNKQPAAPVLSLPPLSGPPSSLSPAKQQKLDALFQQYRADQITPAQYHEQRAKILAEP